MATDKLDLDDAGQIEDLAERVRRAATTARRVASTDPEAAEILVAMADAADAFTIAANTVVGWTEERRR